MFAGIICHAITETINIQQRTEKPVEQRRFSRIRFNMRAELIVNEQGYSFSQVDNLSVGGCLFESDEEFRVGEACLFRLPLDESSEGARVEVFGKIVRCGGGTIGIKFTRIDPDSLFHLQNIIRYNTPDPERIEQEISEHPGLI